MELFKEFLTDLQESLIYRSKSVKFKSAEEAKALIEKEMDNHYNTTFELKKVSDGSIQWF